MIDKYLITLDKAKLPAINNILSGAIAVSIASLISSASGWPSGTGATSSAI
jgi:uncharacterized membrane protein YccC